MSRQTTRESFLVPLRMLLATLLVLLATAFSPALAATWFVGPNGTAKGGDGSQALPFASISAAFGSGKVAGGDVLLLLDGAYGDVVIKGVAPASPVVIRSVNPLRAVFSRLSIEARSANLTFDEITVEWNAPSVAWNNLFSADFSTSGIAITDSTIKAHPDSFNFRVWTKADWIARSATAISMAGKNQQALRNTIVGIGYGIVLNGSDNLAEGNSIDGFSADGLRGNGNRLVFRANRVTNCVSVDGNHADGFQSFNLAKDGSTYDGIVLDGNVILEQTFTPRLPLACQLQAIGMFDGFFSNLTITGNRVEVSGPHGITVAGVAGAAITGNTVVFTGGTRNRPTILALAHKDGRPSSNVMIANNVTTFPVGGPFAPGVNNVLTGASPALPAAPAPGPTPPAPLLTAKSTLAEICAVVRQ